MRGLELLAEMGDDDYRYAMRTNFRFLAGIDAFQSEATLRYGYTPTMASVTVFFVLIAAVVFGLIARFGDIRRLLGAMSSDGK